MADGKSPGNRNKKILREILYQAYVLLVANNFGQKYILYFSKLLAERKIYGEIAFQQMTGILRGFANNSTLPILYLLVVGTRYFTYRRTKKY